MVSESQIRSFTKRLFTIEKLRLRNGLRLEGDESAYVPDIHNNHQVSDWLAIQFAMQGVPLDKECDVVAEIDDNEWRIVNWPKRAYVYQVVREDNTLCIDLTEQHHLRVLALDAGGIAGYFNARLLQKAHTKIEEKVKAFKQAFDDFESSLTADQQERLKNLDQTDWIDELPENYLDSVDHLMGTSAGSVNAAILAQSDKPSTQLDRCISVWKEPRLFDNEPLNRLLAIGGMKSLVSFTKYKKSLSKYIPPDLSLKDLKKSVLFTTFALDPQEDSPRAKPRIFNSKDPKDEGELTLDVVLRSGSAAPIGAFHQGYADGGWFSTNPITHIIPLFRALKDFNTAEHKKLCKPLEHALIQRLISPSDQENPLYPTLGRDQYSTIVNALNNGVLPEELKIRFFKARHRFINRISKFEKITENDNNTNEDNIDITYHLSTDDDIDYELSLKKIDNQDKWIITLKYDLTTPLYPLNNYPNDLIICTRKKTILKNELDELAKDKTGSKSLPSLLQHDYFHAQPDIDLATQPVQIKTETRHYTWDLTIIKKNQEHQAPRAYLEGQQDLREYRIEANPDEATIKLYELRREGIRQIRWKNWFEEYYGKNNLPDEFKNRLTQYTDANQTDLDGKTSFSRRTTAVKESIHFLIEQSRPEAKLTLLSVGVGLKNKRLVMPKEDYHWGYLNLMIPSPWNQFFSLGSAIASAQADTATEQIANLDKLNPELNFHRMDPGVLSLNRFLYSILAINPELKDGVITLLERDLNKPEVQEEAEKTAQWLFRYWILGDETYRKYFELSDHRPNFQSIREACSS